MLAEVCWMLAACSSVRLESVRLPVAMFELASAIVSVELRISPTIPARAAGLRVYSGAQTDSPFHKFLRPATDVAVPGLRVRVGTPVGQKSVMMRHLTSAFAGHSVVSDCPTADVYSGLKFPAPLP